MGRRIFLSKSVPNQKTQRKSKDASRIKRNLGWRRAIPVVPDHSPEEASVPEPLPEGWVLPSEVSVSDQSSV